MKRTLTKALALALVLCMALSQTVFAASYGVTVSVENKANAEQKVSKKFGYQHETVNLVDLLAEAFISLEDTLRTEFESGLNDLVEAGKAAKDDQTAWTAFVEQFDASFGDDADLKAICSDLESTVGDLDIGTYTMEYTNDELETPKTYVVKMVVTQSGGGSGISTPAVDNTTEEKPEQPEEPEQPTVDHDCAITHIGDVAQDVWYHDAICYVVDKGIMKGVSEDSFAPALNTNRAMLMTMLARQAGETTDGGETWYTKGMEWAVANGVSDGTNPESDITREQLVTMLWRYSGKAVVEADLSAFSDVDSISEWDGALEAINWAVANGIMKGADGKLNPQGTATRAEVAQFFMNYMELK